MRKELRQIRRARARDQALRLYKPTTAELNEKFIRVLWAAVCTVAALFLMACFLGLLSACLANTGSISIGWDKANITDDDIRVVGSAAIYHISTVDTNKIPQY